MRVSSLTSALAATGSLNETVKYMNSSSYSFTLVSSGTNVAYKSPAPNSAFNSSSKISTAQESIPILSSTVHLTTASYPQITSASNVSAPSDSSLLLDITTSLIPSSSFNSSSFHNASSPWALNVSSHAHNLSTLQNISLMVHNSSSLIGNNPTYLNTSIHFNSTDGSISNLTLSTINFTKIATSCNGALYCNNTSSNFNISVSTNTSVTNDDNTTLFSTAPKLSKGFSKPHILLASQPQKTEVSKAVFAHYMVGNVNEDHAHQDIDSAAAIGLNGFALNIQDPQQDFVRQTLNYMFDYTRDNHPDFKLFFSLDLWAKKSAGDHLYLYDSLLGDFKGHDAYLLGPNGFSFVSTFSAGDTTNGNWTDWKAEWANEVYFVPDFDGTLGYYTADPGWWAYWGPIVDGIFSWDSIWPNRSDTNVGDLSKDMTVLQGAVDNNKIYMVGLSALQYKNSYDANYYREGELNLPARMEGILNMDPSPDFVEIISWNDGPESHYIGFLWTEQNNDTTPGRYSNQDQWSHTGWQPTITSFINAFRNGLSASEMTPPSDKIAPDGFDAGSDNLNWMVVLPNDPAGMQIRLISNGVIIDTISGKAGLNYGASGNVQAGPQRMELLDASGNVVLASSGGRCISDGCPDCIYNMNYQVVELTEDNGYSGTCPYSVCKKQVFAHYMVGNVYEEHAHKDIDDAAALGIDGFALNVADPTVSYVRELFNYMFDYARDNHPNFKLFLSMDLWGEGNAFDGVQIDLYDDLIRDFKGHDAWLKGPNGYSFISSFSSGGLQDFEWRDWKAKWANQVYLVPDIDDTAGYNTSSPGWWDYWGPVVDGTFSWETAWPKVGQTNDGDTTIDSLLAAGHALHHKSYMMPLSALQYKNAYGANYWRHGEFNFPRRMSQILSMKDQPDFVEIMTWNDGPESHYIGNLWLEQNNDTQPFRYANQEQWSHTGWQPLVASFITAFKAGLGPEDMRPPVGKTAVGSLWYKTILQSSVCPTKDSDPYSQKPDGFEAGNDNLIYAVVLPDNGDTMQLRLISNNVVMRTVSLQAGMNYGTATATAGCQRMELVDSSGNVVMAASGGRCISSGCPDCIYNMNYQVLELTEDTGATCSCPYSVCEKAVFAHYMVGNIYEEHAHTDIDDAVAMGLDGFALNVADPSQPYARQSFNYMFDYARDNHPNFKLFISMDLWALGVPRDEELDLYHDLLRDFKGHDAWYKGPNGYSFVSTFSSGGLYNTDWQAWRDSWAGQVYLVPDFDDTSGYNTSDGGWWDYWGDVVDGTFSWETAWKNPGVSTDIGDVSVDQTLVNGHFQHSKSYMMPLSALQYKNAYGANYYRDGGLNLVIRMENILNMALGPDFVEVITWNDGPESHYIGNLWLEQNNDTQPGLYSNQEEWSHTGWQPLITSFITALKAGSKTMEPPSGKIAVGALWYQTILQSSTCPSDESSQYSQKPNGFETGTDSLNYGVVVPADSAGMQLRFISNGLTLETITLTGGLNYGSVGPASAGAQRMELLDSSRNVLLAATGGRCISGGCPDCIYNMNYQVLELMADTGATGTCPYLDCSSLDGSSDDGSSDDSDGSTDSGDSEIVYVDPSIYTDEYPVVDCIPPCTLVFPPVQLGTTTTIYFPEWTTFLINTYLTYRTTTLPGGNPTTIAAADYVTDTITIDIPPITTTAIDVWFVTYTSGQTTPNTIELTSSIQPLPIVITETPVKSGTTHEPVTKTITAPPYPYSQTSKDTKLNSKTISHSSRKATKTCTIGCGHTCEAFCSGPCLTCLPFSSRAGSGGSPTSGGPNKGKDTATSTECQTVTASSCSTDCIAGSTCTSTCTTYSSCSATDDSAESTFTPAPIFTWEMEDWTITTTINDAEASSIAAYVDTMLSQDFPESTSTSASVSHPKSTKTPAITSAPTSTSTTSSQPVQTTCSVGNECISYCATKNDGEPAGEPICNNHMCGCHNNVT